jgi:hypothetical protein
MVTSQLNDRSPPLLTATPLMRRIAAGLFVSAMLLTANSREGAQPPPPGPDEVGE